MHVNTIITLLLLFTVTAILINRNDGFVYDASGRMAVRMGGTQTKAMSILVKARQDMNILFSALRDIRSKSNIYNIAQRLLQCESDGIYLYEHRPSREISTVAYAYTQSREIYLCLFDDQMAVNRKVLFSVILHELTHLAIQDKHGVNGNTIHSKDFKHAENLLVSLCTMLGLLPLTGAIGKPYCGINIPTPLTSM